MLISSRQSRRPLRAVTLLAPAAAGLFAVLLLPVPPRALAQQTPPAPAPLPAPVPQQQPTGPALDPLAGPIRKNDTLQIDVVGEARLTGRQRVDNDGFISLSMVKQPVKLIGLQTTKAAEVIRQRLITDKILRRPQVTVSIVDRPLLTVTVSGAVTNNQRVPIRESTRLNEVLEPAGLTPVSDLTRVVVSRGDQSTTIDYGKYRKGESIDDQHNPLVQDGDRIFVYSAAPAVVGTFRISGEVPKPGPNAVTEGMTIGQAIELAGGVSPFADKDKIVVQRNGTDIPVPYKAIREGDASKDFKLAKDDVIVVPRTEKPNAFQVIGAVRSGGTLGPATFPLEKPTTLQDAVNAAGGPTDGARVFEVEVRRPDASGQIQSKKYNLNKVADRSTPIEPNDTVVVPYGKPSKNSLGNILGTLSGAAGLLFLFRR